MCVIWINDINYRLNDKIQRGDYTHFTLNLLYSKREVITYVNVSHLVILYNVK